MSVDIQPSKAETSVGANSVGRGRWRRAAAWIGTVVVLGEQYVQACIVKDRHELPPINGRRYHCFVDASGGASDSFTLGVAHSEDDIAVLDAVRECKPPFSHQAVVTEFAATCKTYKCFEVHGDNYSGDIVAEMFRLQGIVYRKSIRTKSEIFLDLLPQINSGRVELLDDVRLFQQLCGLVRTLAKAGRETVCKGAGFHDDLANSAAGALCLAALQPAAIAMTRPIICYEPAAGSILLPPVIAPDHGGSTAPHLAHGSEYSGGGGIMTLPLHKLLGGSKWVK